MEFLDPQDLYTSRDDFIVVLNSKTATNIYNPGYNSSAEFDFREPIKKSRSDIKMCCSVLSFVCPNALYNINETNNLLSITNSYVGIVPQNAGVNYIIPVGNYNSTTLISTLLTLLPAGFSITFNSTNNKFTFSYTQTFSINLTSTISPVIGCLSNTTYLSISNILALPYTCNFNGIEQINIGLTSINTNNIESFSGSKSNCIQPVTIPLNSNQIIYQKTNDYSFAIITEYIDDVKIELRDSYNNLINLNNQHWNLTLLFSVYKDIHRFNHSSNFNYITRPWENN